MTPTLRLTYLLFLTSALSVAAQWSGALVGSQCYAASQRSIHAEHPGSIDTKRPIRLCSPNAKTTSFSVVQTSGPTLNLDSDGNEKARELVLKEGKKSPFMVNVTGELTQDTLKLDTISMVAK
jgi:hypothetical protein